MITLLEHGYKLPEYQTSGSAGADCYAAKPITIYRGKTYVIPLGFALTLDPDQEGQIRPRSSLSAKGVLVHLGTIDSDYRGEVKATVSVMRDLEFTILRGDRICQLVISPIIRHPSLVGRDTQRLGGYGSTGHAG